jgi:hypothetical protein
MIPIARFICSPFFLDGIPPFNKTAQRVEPHDGQKRILCERTLRRTVLDVNKFLAQIFGEASPSE